LAFIVTLLVFKSVNGLPKIFLKEYSNLNGNKFLFVLKKVFLFAATSSLIFSSLCLVVLILLLSSPEISIKSTSGEEVPPFLQKITSKETMFSSSSF